MTAGFHIGIAALRPFAGWAATGCVARFMVQPRTKLIPQAVVAKAPARWGGGAQRGRPMVLDSARSGSTRPVASIIGDTG